MTEEIRDLEAEYSSTETEIEKLIEDIVDDEVLNETEEGETELSKFLRERGEKADDLGRKYEQYKDNAYFVNKDEREDKSLLLEWLGKSTQKDIDTLETAQRELDADDSFQDNISDLLDRLQGQKDKAGDLLEKWHENDLNYIRESNIEDENASEASSKDSFPQDSSDISKTDFSPFDDIGDD